MAELVPLDSAWLKANPLPLHDHAVDKNARGTVLVIGGCRMVPGGIMLTAEAAFRAGAGKVAIAAPAPTVLPIGIAMPECGVLELPPLSYADGKVDVDDELRQRVEKADAIVIGPAMTDVVMAEQLLDMVLDHSSDTALLVLDAAAIRAARAHRHRIVERCASTIMTPNAGEIAALLGNNAPATDEDARAALDTAVSCFGTTVMVKGATSHLSNGRYTLSYAGGGLGLATGGSGDVLAGIIASLGAQGADPMTAAAWGIWLHGEAGRRLGETVGPLGYLARELLPLIPSIMGGVRG